MKLLLSSSFVTITSLPALSNRTPLLLVLSQKAHIKSHPFMTPLDKSSEVIWELKPFSPIGQSGVFSLGGWSPHVQTGFLVPRPTFL